MYRVSSLLVFVTLLLAGCSMVQASAISAIEESSEALTVDQAVQIALENNRAVKIASLSVDSSKEKLAAEKTHRLPAFSTYILGSQVLEPFSFTVAAGQFGTYK